MDFFFTYKSSSARGVAILFNANTFVVKKTKCDVNGNYVALSIHCAFLEFSLIALYVPNNNCPEFYRDVESVLLELDDPYQIIGGDGT